MPFGQLTGTSIKNIIPPMGIRIISLIVFACAADKELAKACLKTRKLSTILFFASVGIFILSNIVTYVVPKIY
tara:strand:+ start:881 stop:1099 length:219 start_codon:yes stop_codon:yes gene_type:complete